MSRPLNVNVTAITKIVIPQFFINGAKLLNSVCTGLQQCTVQQFRRVLNQVFMVYVAEVFCSCMLAWCTSNKIIKKQMTVRHVSLGDIIIYLPSLLCHQTA
jgi:hypothetical protein